MWTSPGEQGGVKVVAEIWQPGEDGRVSQARRYEDALGLFPSASVEARESLGPQGVPSSHQG